MKDIRQRLLATFQVEHREHVQHIRQTLEEEAGAKNEGVRLALYFERKASGVKSAYGILADAALLKVVQTALGIPAEKAARQMVMIGRSVSREDPRSYGPKRGRRPLTELVSYERMGQGKPK